MRPPQAVGSCGTGAVVSTGAGTAESLAWANGAGTLNRVQLADTSPEARETQFASWRAMTGAHRLAMALAMSDDVRVIALAGIAHRHPDLGPPERLSELVRLLSS